MWLCSPGLTINWAKQKIYSGIVTTPDSVTVCRQKSLNSHSILLQNIIFVWVPLAWHVNAHFAWRRGPVRLRNIVFACHAKGIWMEMVFWSRMASCICRLCTLATSTSCFTTSLDSRVGYKAWDTLHAKCRVCSEGNQLARINPHRMWGLLSFYMHLTALFVPSCFTYSVSQA